MAIPLQHLNLRPAPQLLDRAEVHAILDQSRGECVPQRMRSHVRETSQSAGGVEAIADGSIRAAVGLFKHKLATPGSRSSAARTVEFNGTELVWPFFAYAACTVTVRRARSTSRHLSVKASVRSRSPQ